MTSRVRRQAVLIVAAVVMTAATIAVLAPGQALAHASLIGREDLPLPQWLFIYGALLIIIVSFVGLLLAWREPHFEARPERPAGRRLSSLLLNPFTEALAGLVGVALTVLVVWTGLDGVVAPDRNFSVSFVFVTFWLGLTAISVIFGDVFRAFNPWRAIGRTVSAGFSLVAGQRAPAPLVYPERLGRWPAAIAVLGFVFLELVWGQSGFTAAGISPRDVAIATLVYSAYTFAAMALFGVDRWIDRGEAFSQYFGMFASLAPLAYEDGRIMLRRPLSGATTWSGPAGSLALVLVAIGGTTFDGAQEGDPMKEWINSLYGTLVDLGASPVASLRLTNTLFLLIALAVVTGIFWAGILGMKIVERKRSAKELGALFAHAFIPIALAYIVAHYFSYVVYLEQAQFTFLLSDPFGTGDDIFGTADSGIDYTVLNASAIQYTQFGAIVVGHVLALALGHDRALKIWGNTRDAAWSQVWMLVMMMFFSMLGLYLLSEANG